VYLDHIGRRKTGAIMTLQTARETVGLAMLASLVFFARTDWFWLPIVAGVWLAIAERPYRRNVLVYGAVVVLLVAPYLAYNLLTQGSLMPISGKVKLYYLETFYPTLERYLTSEEWRGYVAAVANTFQFEPKGTGTALVALGGPGIALALQGIYCARAFSLGDRLLSISAVLHMVYMHLFYRELHPYTSYYFAPEVLWLVVTGASWLAYALTGEHKGQVQILAASRGLAAAVVALFCLAVAISFGHGYEPGLSSYWVQRVKLAEAIQRLVPEGERIGAFGPGCFAEFGDRTVIPLDGVVASNTYFETYVRTGTEIDYLAEREIRYLAIYLTGNPDELLAGASPRIGSWSLLGVVRLWENRHLPMRVVAARQTNTQGTGWYLIEFQ
jgi:hypothetical protein